MNSFGGNPHLVADLDMLLVSFRAARRSGHRLLVLVGLLVPLMASPQAPATRRGDVIDVLHGTRIPDPFRWLEDLNSAETGQFIAAQNTYTAAWFAGGHERSALRERIHRRLTELWNFPRTTVPYRLRNGVLFHSRNSGLQKQFEVVARSSPATAPRVIIDPNAISPDGSIALAQWEPAPDGRHVAYALAEGGADWQEVRIRSVRTGQDLPDVLRWVRFSAFAWTRDGAGFFYSRYPEVPEAERLSARLEHQKLYYHRLGTTQDQDILVYERPDLSSWFVFNGASEDGRYAWIYLSKGADSKNRLHVLDLGNPLNPDVRGAVRPIVETDDGEYTVIGNDGRTVYLLTDLDAPRKRVVAVNMDRPARQHWTTVIPQGPHAIASVAMTSSGFVVHRMVDVTSELTLTTLAGRPAGRVSLPGPGTVGAIQATRASASFYYGYTSHLTPLAVYQYEARTRKSVPFDPAKLAFDPSAYETSRVFATSPDGTRVPLFISARKGLVRDGSAPALLYAYGGFAVPVPPAYSTTALAWMDMGGVYVTAALRGGNEYGEGWHQAGMLDRKQNVFNDFIAAAEYLVKDGWTSARRLVIDGASNGGLLVGAVMTQRPELFAVAIPQVGVLDMLRYHKFTGGAAWTTEYGSADDPAAFDWLLKYSPLHNVRPGTCYPATIITTADHDDRVVPSHSYKFAAALQAAQGCDRPVLLRVEAQGSHGYRPTDRQIAEYADLWTFAWSHAAAPPLER